MSKRSNSRPAPPKNHQQDFQTGWTRWFEGVEQLEPESPRLEPDEYGKSLIDKYKRQGLDL